MEWSNWLTAATVLFTSVLAWRLFRTKEISRNADTKKSNESEKSPPSDSHHDKDEPINDVVYVNKAYKNNEVATSTAVSHDKPSVVTETKPENSVTNEKHHVVTSNDAKPYEQHHKVSDVSTIFRPPTPDEKTFSEFVIEKFDRKSMTLRSQRVSPDENPPGVSTRLEPVNDLNLTEDDGINTERTDCIKEVDDDNLSPDYLPSESNVKANTNNTEWREKLKLDLMDDDDEEFLDESSESESDDDDHNDDDDDDEDDDDVMDLHPDENGVNSLTVKRELTSCSSTHKLVSERAIVIDNGSYLVRGGWAGEFRPIISERNVIGSWRAEASEAWQEMLGSKFIGETAIQRHSTLALEHPIEDGKVTSWRGVQDVFQHIVGKELEADLSHHPILITEPINVDKKQREKMVEILIERNRSPGVCLKSQAAMCAVSVNHKVGLVINSGYGSTEIVPMYEGYPLIHCATTLPVGGRHITDYLARLLQTDKGLSFTTVPEIEIVNSIKERYAEVPLSSTMNSRKNLPDQLQEYTLPDGRVIEFGDELERCTEPLFSPGLIGNSSFGLPSLVQTTLDRLDPDVMNESDNHILLAGGNSNLGGLKTRLQIDLSEKMNGHKVSLKQCESGDCAWIGSSIVAEQSNFSDICVTEDLYFDRGAHVVHRLCI